MPQVVEIIVGLLAFLTGGQSLFLLVPPLEVWHSSLPPLEPLHWVFALENGLVHIRMVYAPLELAREFVLVYFQFCHLVFAEGCLVVFGVCPLYHHEVVVVYLF